MYSLELEKSRMEQAIVQRDEQLMQMRGLPGAHPQGLPLQFFLILHVFVAKQVAPWVESICLEVGLVLCRELGWGK